MGDSFEVIMAAYQSAGQAERDFDAVVRLVKDKTVRSEGVILVEQDADGRVSVSQTGDHLGRKGLGWGGGVGLVVGLFSPPLLASVVVGGAVGALTGKFARHKVDSGIEQGSGTSSRRAPRSSSPSSTATTGWPPSRRWPVRWPSRPPR
jgi:uncharacterized membrane protein